MAALAANATNNETRRKSRPRKRARKAVAEVEEQLVASQPSTSTQTQKESQRLFMPFRALGLVSNHVPFALQTRSFKGATDGPRVHILTCLGRSWALWEGGKMTLLFVGSEVEESIHALAMDGDYVWAAAGSELIQYQRGKEVKRAKNPLGSRLGNMIIFGAHIMALTEDGRRLLAWSTETAALVSTIELATNFTATTLLHPSTYLNKILLGSTSGTLQLWNISTQTLIYSFPNEKLSDSSHRDSPITCLVQSPAIDVVGIGFVSGEISVYDVRCDERLMRMWQEGGGVNAMAFRADGEGVLASASSNGHITLWDLSAGGRLLHIIRGAHDAAVTAIEWIPGQPILVSSGADNSVKQWLFDSPTSPPRLLKFRAGHFSPPHLIRYYGTDGKALLTASRDRSLRYMSVVRDSRSTELSQGHLAKKATSLSIPIASLKFTPVTSLSFSSARSKDWDDVLTSHTEESFARTWSVQNKKLGNYHLAVHDNPSSAKKGGVQGSVKAVHVTACGNFGMAANSAGVIGMWNMQSGIRRKTFKLPGGKEGKNVVGLASDALNTVVIVATLEGSIHFFDFHTSDLTHTLPLPSSISAIHLQRDSNLLAVTSDDMCIRIIDITTHRVARELTGFKGRILDMDFSADSRWVITTSLDSVVRTFDVPTGRMIDAFKTKSLATSLAFSPTGDFLATAHVDSVGVYLWANRAQYAEVSFRHIPQNDEELAAVNLPGVEGMAEDEELPDMSSLEINSSEDVFSSPKQLEGDLVTLTLLPRSRWQSLLNLDVIQERNKPKEAPKAPEKAPFFLPTLPGVEHRFDTNKQQEPEEESSTGKKKKVGKVVADARSHLQVKLSAEAENGDYHVLFEYIKTLSPAAMDLELRTLTSLEDLARFMHALEQRLKSHRDFEAVQTLLAAFTRLHAEVLIQNDELGPLMRSLLETQKRESRRVIELLTSSLGTLTFVRNIG